MQVIVETLTITAVVFGVFVALGTAADHLLIRHQKAALHRKLTAWWVKIYETRVVDLGKLMASSTLNAMGRIFRWPFFSWRTFGLSILLSFFITSFSIMLGGYFDGERTWYSMPAFGVYLLNYLLDSATIIVTIKALQTITQSKPITNFFLVLIDILIAFLLASCCIAALSWGQRTSIDYMKASEFFSIFLIEDPDETEVETKREKKLVTSLVSQNKEELRIHGFHSEQVEVKILQEFPDYVSMLSSGPLCLLQKFSNSIKIKANYRCLVAVKDPKHEIKLLLQAKISSSINWKTFFASSTTLIPTAFYMIILISISLAKIILESSRFISMQLLERITQDDPDYDPDKFKPGTLFGYLFGSFAALSNAFVVIIKTLSS